MRRPSVTPTFEQFLALLAAASVISAVAMLVAGAGCASVDDARVGVEDATWSVVAAYRAPTTAEARKHLRDAAASLQQADTALHPEVKIEKAAMAAERVSGIVPDIPVIGWVAGVVNALTGWVGDAIDDDVVGAYHERRRAVDSILMERPPASVPSTTQP